MLRVTVKSALFSGLLSLVSISYLQAESKCKPMEIQLEKRELLDRKQAEEAAIGVDEKAIEKLKNMLSRIKSEGKQNNNNHKQEMDDLETKLSAAKSKLEEIVKKLSTPEMASIAVKKEADLAELEKELNACKQAEEQEHAHEAKPNNSKN